MLVVGGVVVMVVVGMVWVVVIVVVVVVVGVMADLQSENIAVFTMIRQY